MRTIWTAADLAAVGTSRRQIAAAVRTEQLQHVRPGWFAVAGADPQIVRAVRVGGFATAHTASRALGLWTPPDQRAAAFRRNPAMPPMLHVAVRATSSFARLRDPDDPARPFVSDNGVVVHWSDPAELRGAARTGRAGVLLMLEHLFRSETPERALAVVDSALRERHLRLDERYLLAARLPAHLRPVVLAADGRAESGIETIVRFLLRQLGLRVEVQVEVSGVGRVDLLVEGRLIVECDGREWHDDDEAFERDRTRDLAAATGRYRVLRCSWFQVLFRWAEVERAVLVALA